MNGLDALARVVLNYIAEREGQTILIKDISQDTAITQTTIRRKLKLLESKGYIKRDGKKFFTLRGDKIIGTQTAN